MVVETGKLVLLKELARIEACRIEGELSNHEAYEARACAILRCDHGELRQMVMDGEVPEEFLSSAVPVEGEEDGGGRENLKLKLLVIDGAISILMELSMGVKFSQEEAAVEADVSEAIASLNRAGQTYTAWLASVILPPISLFYSTSI